MRAIYNRLFGPTTDDLIDCAFKRAAEAEAEVAKQNVLIARYTDLLAKIDPMTDWWSFAQAMQNKHDAEQELAVLVPRSVSAADAAAALITNYKGDAA